MRRFGWWPRIRRPPESGTPLYLVAGAVVLGAALSGRPIPPGFGYGDPEARISVEGLGQVPLLLAFSPEPAADPSSRPAHPVQASFAEAVEAARLAWSGQDAAAIVAGSRSLMLQLPGAGARASVGRDQAIRLVAGILHRSEAVSVRVQTAREVGPGQGYAELVRQYRVTGTDEVRSQRILLAFRQVPSLGRWELVELRVLQDSE